MKHRILGRTTLKVSILGFGASPLGNVFGETSFDQNQRAVDKAIDAGINFFDVSPYYGQTLAEQRLGCALEGKRQKIVLATKCGRYGLDEFDFSRRRIRASVEESLKRLRTDYVDLLQAHDIEFAPVDQIIQETIPALRELQLEGKTRFIGITGYPLKLLKKVAVAIPVDTVLSYCRYNLLNTDMEDILSPLVEDRGVGLINASPLMMGVLTSQGPPPWHFASAATKQAGKRAAEAARANGISIESLALQFSMSYAAVSSTLVGMATPGEVINNVKAAESPLKRDAMQAVQSAIGNGFKSTWLSGLAENTVNS